MAKVRTIKLIGPALDWAVMLCEHEGRAEGWLKTYLAGGDQRFVQTINDSPSTNWDQGGPIIEREELFIQPTGDDAKWKSYVWSDSINNFTHHQYGETPLIASMRCYVSYKLGDIIGIPDELIEEQ